MLDRHVERGIAAALFNLNSLEFSIGREAKHDNSLRVLYLHGFEHEILADQELDPLDVFALFKLVTQRGLRHGASLGGVGCGVSEYKSRRSNAQERQKKSQDRSHDIFA